MCLLGKVEFGFLGFIEFVLFYRKVFVLGGKVIVYGVEQFGELDFFFKFKNGWMSFWGEMMKS